MSFTTALWRVSKSVLTPIDRVKLDSERRLEDWLAADLGLLGYDLLLIARQAVTPAGRIDLLALDENGTIIVIELKKDKTPREVVAQVLDYGSWVSEQTYETLNSLYMRKDPRGLAEAFREKFECGLPDDAFIEHRLVIVASELDDSSERIVNYLADVHQLGINVVFFNIFLNEGIEFVSRSWLADPEEIEVKREMKKAKPWSGLYYVNVGMDHPKDERPVRYWPNCKKLGYLAAGGHPRFWKPLHRLQIGDQVMAYVKKAGYVGYGIVTQLAAPIHKFRLTDGTILSEAFGVEQDGNEDRWEHAVGVDWRTTFAVQDAKWFLGAFAKPPVVCKILDEKTAAFLSREFGIRAGSVVGN